MNTPPRLVWVHVGVPKTGTSQIQDLLHLNRGSLRDEHGILYPAEGHDDHFMAALDLTGQEWGGLEQRAVGAWGRLVEQANAHDGPVVISHEVFAAASPEQTRRALDTLDGEVHVVVSSRDLHRQIPAEWQEGVKHRRRTSYADFCRDVVAADPSLPASRWFWRVQDVPRVLERWGAALPPERVHVVTVPGRDAPRDLLVGRLLHLFGIDPAWVPLASDRENVSLGAAETTVIRRLNELLPAERLEGDTYRFRVREVLAHRTLAQRSGARIVLPEVIADWADATAATWIAELERAGYDVVGDLDELAPERTGSPWYDPDAAPVADQLDVTYAALEALLLDSAAMDVELRRLRLEHDELIHLRTEHDELLALRLAVEELSKPPPPGPWMRTKQRVVAFGERSTLVRGVLRGWRFVRRH